MTTFGVIQLSTRQFFFSTRFCARGTSKGGEFLALGYFAWVLLIIIKAPQLGDWTHHRTRRAFVYSRSFSSSPLQSAPGMYVLYQVPGYIPGIYLVCIFRTHAKSTTLLATFAIAKFFLRNTLLSADVRHRVSLVVLPFRGAAVFSHAGAFRRAFQLREKPVRTSDAVRFCRRSRRVLVRVDRTGGTILHSTALFLLAIGPFWAL